MEGKMCYGDSSGAVSGLKKHLELSPVINFCPSW